jgi:hypothetical protein
MKRGLVLRPASWDHTDGRWITHQMINTAKHTVTGWNDANRLSDKLSFFIHTGHYTNIFSIFAVSKPPLVTAKASCSIDTMNRDNRIIRLPALTSIVSNGNLYEGSLKK